MSIVAQTIEELLAEQGDLSAVDTFARRHDLDRIAGEHYRALLPARAPRPGEQFGFEVDLDQCSGCKACVTACHSLNGLDHGESWRDMGTLVGTNPAHPLVQTVTTACHHCAEPGCLDGCPVLAYEKDPITGIVRHLDDQCMGCSYCILKCPYEVPKYNARRGIVRKCDMCAQRLALDEAPACVAACPNEAIRIGLIDTSIPAETADRPWLAVAPPAWITRPTTRYITRHTAPGLVSPTRGLVEPRPAHWPLIWMLVFTQCAAGLVAFATMLRPQLPTAATDSLWITGWLALHAGLVASVFHLGQPARAWRSFLGWKRSWMSREILSFGAFSALLSASLLGRIGGVTLPHWIEPIAAAAGIVSVAASAMVYVDTHRPVWRTGVTFPAFLGTTALLGGLAGAAILCLSSASRRIATGAILLGLDVGVVAAIVLALADMWRRRAARHLLGQADHDAEAIRSQIFGWARPLLGVLWGTLFGGVLLAWMSIADNQSPSSLAAFGAGAALAAACGGALLERFLFFTTAAHRGMPGVTPCTEGAKQ